LDEDRLMASLKMEWTLASKAQFEELRQRAAGAGKKEQFNRVHNEIVFALQELTQALEKGELLYNTRRAGGEVRHWIHRFISVCYAVFRHEQVGWVVAYKSVPASWPEV
jgi:hypothetical protein